MCHDLRYSKSSNNLRGDKGWNKCKRFKNGNKFSTVEEKC